MSGLIPQPFIDELIIRTNIVELIDSYVPLKKAGHNFTACCPFHNEKTPSFNVITKKQFYYCFGCGASGNCISFVMDYLNQNFPDAIATLAARLNMPLPQESSLVKNSKSSNLYKLLQAVSEFYQHTLHNKDKEAITYLQRRGVSEQIAKFYQLGYAPDQWQTLTNYFKKQNNELITTGMLIAKDGKTYDRYRKRIIFPIHDLNGHIIGFGGRSIEAAQKPKYINSPDTVLFQKSRELYGLYQILTQRKIIEAIIIVEGYLDVISLAQYGIDNAVAALGTSTSLFHIQLLSKYTKQLIFCFDGDAAGQTAAWRALENCLPQLNMGLQVHFVFLPAGHDPDSLVRLEGAEKFRERIASAQALSDFFLSNITQNLDLGSMAGKSKLINIAKSYLGKMPEGPYKELLLDELARISHIDTHRLNKLISDQTAVKYDKINSIRPINKNKAIARTPIRLAIALLIQNPEIFITCKERINPDILEGSGQKILQKLLQQLAVSPNSNTATLLEKWRNTSFFLPLTKLASWDHQVPQEALTKEFSDIMVFLQRKNLEDKIKLYIAKSREGSLTLEEKFELQTMLKQRHRHEESY